MPKVIFDSSFLMAVMERPTTWYEDLGTILGKVEPVMLDCVREELLKISNGEGKRARFASLALEVSRGFAPLPCGGAEVDDEIVSAALSHGAAVATVDGTLIQSLRSAKVKVMSLGGGRVIERS
ncbi:MAG: hypothetical protein HY247_03165 [archaeon]|nr:MAG: hypothetical protein HY247_03165 [archaeon]